MCVQGFNCFVHVVLSVCSHCKVCIIMGVFSCLCCTGMCAQLYYCVSKIELGLVQAFIKGAFACQVVIFTFLVFYSFALLIGRVFFLTTLPRGQLLINDNLMSSG